MISNEKKRFDPLANIRIVLVETSHTGNVGSAARAMKTMGLAKLYLVNPRIKPNAHARALASGASDIVENATLCATLDDAIADCRLVVATSARSRTLVWPSLEPRTCAQKLIVEADVGDVALIFGPERIGLTNKDLQKCHYHVTILANPDYSSLNLAMSVQILAYEIRMAMLVKRHDSVDMLARNTFDQDYPLMADLEHFYRHLEQTLRETGFINSAHPGDVMSKLRRLYNRARPELKELNILRGMLTAMNKKMK